MKMQVNVDTMTMEYVPEGKSSFLGTVQLGGTEFQVQGRHTNDYKARLLT